MEDFMQSLWFEKRIETSQIQEIEQITFLTKPKRVKKKKEVSIDKQARIIATKAIEDENRRKRIEKQKRWQSMPIIPWFSAIYINKKWIHTWLVSSRKEKVLHYREQEWFKMVKMIDVENKIIVRLIFKRKTKKYIIKKWLYQLPDEVINLLFKYTK
jgi:hypothetical protein